VNLLRCAEETELATKSEQDMKLLQRAISELQMELRTETKHAKESQYTTKVLLLLLLLFFNLYTPGSKDPRG